jgi:hypothetical protein
MMDKCELIFVGHAAACRSGFLRATKDKIIIKIMNFAKLRPDLPNILVTNLAVPNCFQTNFLRLYSHF